MSYQRHHAIIVSTWDRERAAKAHSYALALFGERQVTPILVSDPNAINTFFVGPDGSQEGWEESDIGDQRREQFIEWLDRGRAPDQGHSYYDWAEVRYGDEARLLADPPDDAGATVIAHSDEEWREERAIKEESDGD